MSYKIMYCSNIFKNNTKKKLIKNINKLHIKLKIKNKKEKINIGLCISNKISNEIKKNIIEIKQNFKKKFINIISINGFVYKSFHLKNIKDKIYWPDWTSKKRTNFTKNLIEITKQLKNKKDFGSISTMPISYKYWIKKKKQTYIFYKSSKNLITLTKYLKKIILSIEPEPCCLIETSSEFIKYINKWLEPLFKRNNKKKNIKKYIGLCYDICHFSVKFEKHKKILKKIREENITIGKLQISSAIKIKNKKINKKKINFLIKSPFLHQTTYKYKNRIKTYKDIKYAIKNVIKHKHLEWRIHCHIPIYFNKYKSFLTTNNEIIKVLNEIKKNKFTKHMEIETYTYRNLKIKYDIFNSILKEYKWLKKIIKNVK